MQYGGNVMLRHIASGKAVTILDEPSEIQSRVKMCVSSSLTAGSFFAIVPIFKVDTVQRYFRNSILTFCTFELHFMFLAIGHYYFDVNECDHPE